MPMGRFDMLALPAGPVGPAYPYFAAPCRTENRWGRTSAMSEEDSRRRELATDFSSAYGRAEESLSQTYSLDAFLELHEQGLASLREITDKAWSICFNQSDAYQTILENLDRRTEDYASEIASVLRKRHEDRGKWSA